MLLDKFRGAEQDGAIRIDWGGQYGGLISIFSVLAMGTVSSLTNKEIKR